MKTLLSIILFMLSACEPVYAGYTLFVRPQVTPQYIVVNGAYGTESRPNPGPPITPPAGTLIYRPANFSVYSTATANRTELWQTVTGTELDSNILAATIGLKDKVKADVLQVRKDALAKITTDNAGILAIYDANYDAAKAVIAGTGDMTIAKDGRTATVYITAFGTRLSMTALQFANWLINENQRVGVLAARVEDEYLRITYGVIPSTIDVAVLLALPAQFRGFSGL